MITENCEVRLTDGSRATIVEIKGEDNFLAEVWTADEDNLKNIHRSNIKALIKRVEVALV